MTEYRFIEPLDVLFLRGNRLFGDGSAGGDAVMPPMPSVVAGALRSRMLVSAGVDLAAFGRGEASLPPGLDQALGSPAVPGEFTLTTLLTARQRAGGGVEPLFPLPADLQVFGDDGGREVRMLHPVHGVPAAITGSALPALPALRRDAPGKPVAGYWLTLAGWRRYVAGEAPPAQELVHQSTLWAVERRLGIALDPRRRAAGDGLLYTSDAVSPVQGDGAVGLLAGVAGAPSEWLPADGLLRLGGDARGAAVRAVADPGMPEVDGAHIADTGCFRVVLTSPGLFPGGWRLPGLNAAGQWTFPGGSARLVAAAVPRAVTVSGWDLAAGGRTGGPKTARRAVPAGAVYWFEGFQGAPDALGNLAGAGLWGLAEENDLPSRRAEGFNRFAVANA